MITDRKNGRTVPVIAATALAWILVSGCSRDSVDSLPTTEKRLPPAIPVNEPVASGGDAVTGELYVIDSVPVDPPTSVSIIALDGPRLLVSEAVPSNVRWKVNGPFQSPTYPASGFVIFTLSQDEWKAIQDAGDVAILPDEKSNHAARRDDE